MKIKEALQALIPSIDVGESLAAARRASIQRAVGQPPIAQCVSCDIGTPNGRSVPVLDVVIEGVETCL